MVASYVEEEEPHNCKSEIQVLDEESPNNIKQAIDSSRENGNTLWLDVVYQ